MAQLAVLNSAVHAQEEPIDMDWIEIARKGESDQTLGFQHLHSKPIRKAD